jgi:YbbR domain-containing protein
MPRLRDLVFRHWPLKLAALVLSLMLWVAVTAGQTTTQLVTVELEVDVAPTLTLVGAVPTVRALVTGPARELLKLYASPPRVRAEVPATAAPPSYRLTILPGEVRLPEGARVSIQGVEPREVDIELDRLVERTIPVALRGVVEAESGFALAGQPVFSPPYVRVTGPRTDVLTLDSIPTEPIEVRGVTAAFERRVPIDSALAQRFRVLPREVVLSGRVRPT